MSKSTLQGWVRQRASDKTLVCAKLGREWIAVEHSVIHLQSLYFKLINILYNCKG